MDTATGPMQLVYEKPETLTDTPMHYCPGCGHGVVHQSVDGSGGRNGHSE